MAFVEDGDAVRQGQGAQARLRPPGKQMAATLGVDVGKALGGLTSSSNSASSGAGSEPIAKSLRR